MLVANADLSIFGLDLDSENNFEPYTHEMPIDARGDAPYEVCVKNEKFLFS